MNQVVTRFAPSPTGELHLGGARTALFNWAYAKRFDGKFLLRSEDTDRERSDKKYTKSITDGLKWLGLDWYEGIVSQTMRKPIHVKIAKQLLSMDKAYKDDGAIRIKIPDSGITVKDEVRGIVDFPKEGLNDFVILRSDETPTYMLAVVVDDHDMGITHIIRGDDHLTNAAKQVAIYNAMSWEVPVMAHIPLIMHESGKKMSKRDVVGEDMYICNCMEKYLPNAMVNYLSRLGWGHDDDEIFDMEHFVQNFDISGIGKSSARMDLKKLENLSGHYIRESDDQLLINKIIPSDMRGDENIKDALMNAMPGMKVRVKNLIELRNMASYIWEDSIKPDTVLSDENKSLLSDIENNLKNVENWDVGSLEIHLKNYAEAKSIKLGELAMPMRVALTGRKVSQGIFDILHVLGKEKSLERISAAQ